MAEVIHVFPRYSPLAIVPPTHRPSGNPTATPLSSWVLADPSSVPDAVAAAAYRASMSAGTGGAANQVMYWAGQAYLLRTRLLPQFIAPATNPETGAGEIGFMGSILSSTAGGAAYGAMTFVYVQRGSSSAAPSGIGSIISG